MWKQIPDFGHRRSSAEMIFPTPDIWNFSESQPPPPHCMIKSQEMKSMVKTSPKWNIRKASQKNHLIIFFQSKRRRAGLFPATLGEFSTFASISTCWHPIGEEAASFLLSQDSPPLPFGFHSLPPTQKTHSDNYPLLPWQASSLMMMKIIMASVCKQLNWIKLQGCTAIVSLFHCIEKLQACLQRP